MANHLDIAEMQDCGKILETLSEWFGNRQAPWQKSGRNPYDTHFYRTVL